MNGTTKIEWTDKTWNPIRGCSRVSEGCRNCYAERVAARFSGPGMPYEGLARSGDCPPRWTGEVRFIEKHLADPLHWKKPCRVFVNSMSDLFHEKVEWTWTNRIFGVMATSPRHTFQILTKRPKRMLAWARAIEEAEAVPRSGCTPWLRDWPGKDGEPAAAEWPLPNVWLGVSVEDQKTADERIPLLLETPAAVRWVSYEPALDRVYFDRYLRRAIDESVTLDWIVCGGESGPGARPMHPDWARSVRDQCQAAGVPFFFKQWGEWEPECNFEHRDMEFLQTKDAIYDGSTKLCAYKVGKKAAGRLLDGREWNEYPDA